jgi:hypothetical protein
MGSGRRELMLRSGGPMPEPGVRETYYTIHENALSANVSNGTELRLAELPQSRGERTFWFGRSTTEVDPQRTFESGFLAAIQEWL